MKMCFLHGTQNLLVPRHPGKCLFAAHGIVPGVFFFQHTWVVPLLVLWVFVIPDVQCVYHFSDVLPNVLEVTYEIIKYQTV